LIYDGAALVPQPSKKRSKVTKEMVRWSFGVGEEGIKNPEKSEHIGWIIDQNFPCWWSAAKSVGITVTKVWLHGDSVFHIDYLRTFVGSVPLHVGPDPPPDMWDDVNRLSVLLVGGSYPKVLNDKRLWRGACLRLVVVTSGLNFKPPKGWFATRHNLSHASVGGVTNGVYNVTSIGHQAVSAGVEFDETPGQDLRAILKTGEPGQRTMNLTLPPRRDAANMVNFCGHGVILEASLWPTEKPDVRVKTMWRNQYHIERRLSNFERLLAMDLTERLIKTTPGGLDRQVLIRSIHTPGKVLHAILVYLWKVVRTPDIIRKRKSMDMCEGGNLKHRKVSSSVESGGVLNTPSLPFWMGDDAHGFGGPTLQAHRFSSSVATHWVSALPTVLEEDLFLNPASVDEYGSPNSSMYNDKATKSDSAAVRTELWTKHLLQGLDQKVRGRDIENSCLIIQSWLLTRWKRNVTLSYLRWKREFGDSSYDSDALDCIRRAANSTWWSWDDGSRPFFWRWPEEYVSQVRDGVNVWFDGSVSHFTRKQKGTLNTTRSEMIRTKLDTIRDKGYVEDGQILSLMSYFDVPKGEDDVRMVYDGTASGLNGTLWAPWFPLPNNSCLLRALEPGYCMADNDVGEMFHNFMLHKDLRQFCGLDFSPYYPAEVENRNSKGRLWMRWNRLAMGLRPSPYCATQGMMIAREIILGDRFDSVGNVFHWDHMRLNLPGSVSYTPTKAWATKVRANNEVAADVFIYVDDIRCSAPTQLEAWKASQRTSSVLGMLGLQDAARKRRDPGQETGAWTGSIVWTSNDHISVKTTQEKWDKLKMHLRWLVDNTDNKEGLDNRKLQSIRGFMVYVSQTYGSMVPYLKGIHATIDSWRYGRSPSGWKLPKSKVMASHNLDEEDELVVWREQEGLTPLSQNEPKFVFPVPRFRNDIKCLLALTSSQCPPTRLGRMSRQAKVIYGFGDASKHGFGASIELPDKSIVWRFGQWRLEEEYERSQPTQGLSFMEERSSNYRELRNLVEALESAYSDGLLANREIFMFTDNSTAEAAFFKGSSSSELLFELVLRLRKLEMSGDCIIHMIHVAGTRMIHQGTDGLSRGDKTSGVMAGDSMLSFIPLHLSALDRSPSIRDWVEEFAGTEVEGGAPLRFLDHNHWPDVLNFQATYVWTPPPSVGNVAAEYMAQAIHKRPNSAHIFICPRLMSACWQRIVRKTTDLFLTLPLGSNVWDVNQHEPLILAISFPLSKNRPWKHGGTPSCDHYAKILPGLFLEDHARSIVELRKCFSRAWGMAQL
jgi:hypothetical protein